jgi:hypothetical protein
MLFIFSKKAAFLDKKLELYMGKAGHLILKFILLLSYIFIILPSRIFYRSPKELSTNFKNIDKEKVDFRKPW